MNNWTDIRSLLFVPAGKLDKWDKVAVSGADTICVDLEDSVPPNDKDRARAYVGAFLEKKVPAEMNLIVRINSPDSEAGKSDLDMIFVLDSGVHGMMIPKINDASPLREIGKKLRAAGKLISLFPLIESAQALENGREILSCENVDGAVFGGHDLAMQLGCSKEWDVLSVYRSEFIRSAGGLNLSLIDMPWFGLDDQAGLKHETKNAKRFGFTAKSAVHPAQVKTINAVFTPADVEVAEAAEMIRIFEEAGGHAVAWKGKVLEPPVIDQAKRIVNRAKNLSQH